MESKNIEQLDRFLKAMNQGVLTIEQFNAFIESLKKMLGDYHQINQKTIDGIKQLYETLLNSQGQRHENAYNDLIKKVDSLFIGTQLEKIIKEHMARMKAIDDKIASVKDGNPGIPGEKGDKGDQGDMGSPDTGKDIVEKINDLPIDDENLKIDVDHIKGLKDLTKDIKILKQRPIGGMIGGGNARGIIKAIDISSSLDGSTKTFNIQAVWRVITIQLSSFPFGALQENVHWNWTPTSVTFTSVVDAPTQLAAGQSCILLVAEA